MCMNYKYFIQLKPECDFKYLKTGIQSQFVYLCEVKDVQSGKIKLDYDKEHYNLIVKECGQCLICRFKKAEILFFQVSIVNNYNIFSFYPINVRT